MDSSANSSASKGYRIRSAVAGDVESVLALDREIETLPHWRAADYLAALPNLGQAVDIDAVRRCFFVAEAQSVIVGFVVGKVAASEELAELESVGVLVGVRRLGVGKALCSTVIEWSTRMGAAALELEVRSQSAGPIAMYQALGFVPVGRRGGYYREPVDDAIVMRVVLGARAVS